MLVIFPFTGHVTLITCLRFLYCKVTISPSNKICILLGDTLRWCQYAFAPWTFPLALHPFDDSPMGQFWCRWWLLKGVFLICHSFWFICWLSILRRSFPVFQICLFKSVWTCGFLLYSMGHNLFLSLCILMFSLLTDFASGSSIRLTPVRRNKF